jgi:hypothetical protein
LHSKIFNDYSLVIYLEEFPIFEILNSKANGSNLPAR